VFVAVQQGSELCCLTGHSDKVTTVACTSDGTVCSGSLDRTVRLWKPTVDATSADQFHDADVTSVASSEDGRQVATASRCLFLLFVCLASLPVITGAVLGRQNTSSK